MPVTIDGTNGITNGGGYTGDGVSFADATPANTLVTTTGGNVGIGTTVPAARLDVRCAAGGTSIYATDATNSTLSIKHQTGSLLTYETAGAAIQRWVLNGAERMRVTNVGAFLVGTTSQLATNVFSEIKDTTADSWPLALNGNNRGLIVRNSSATSGYYAWFEYNGGTYGGSIAWSGNTTSYLSASDERLKENIVDAPEAGSLIDAIQVRSWDFKTDSAHWRYGMVAQELLPIFPEAVNAPDDPEMMMGVDYSKLVPMLVKEIQSLRARLAAVEGAIA